MTTPVEVATKAVIAFFIAVIITALYFYFTTPSSSSPLKTVRDIEYATGYCLLWGMSALVSVFIYYEILNPSI